MFRKIKTIKNNLVRNINTKASLIKDFKNNSIRKKRRLILEKENLDLFNQIDNLEEIKIKLKKGKSFLSKSDDRSLFKTNFMSLSKKEKTALKKRRLKILNENRLNLENENLKKYSETLNLKKIDYFLKKGKFYKGKLIPLSEKEKAILKKRKLEILKEIENLKVYYGINLHDYNLSNLINYSTILAREILITESFINRIKRESKRPVVVIGNGGTGEPYVWSIKSNKDLFVINGINYPSVYGSEGYLKNRRVEAIEKIKKMFNKYDSKKPIYIFVDSSTSARMPSAFLGFDQYRNNGTYMPFEYSLYSILENFGKETSAVGYNWSSNSAKIILRDYYNRNLLDKLQFNDRLPKNNINLKNTDVILFNPVGKGKDPEKYSALHDDTFGYSKYRSNKFRNYVLDKVLMLKKNLFSDKK